MEANLPSTFELIEKITDALLWVSIIVCAFIILSAMNGNDDDPDLYA